MHEAFLNTLKTLRKIDKITKLYNKELHVRIFSNLLMEDISLLKFLITSVKENEINFINWRTSFDLDGRFKSNESLKIYMKNIWEISDLLNSFNNVIKIKSCITKKTIKDFNTKSYIFSCFYELINKFNFIFSRYEIIDKVTEDLKEKYFIDKETFYNFFLNIKSVLPNFKYKYSSNILGLEPLCQIERWLI